MEPIRLGDCNAKVQDDYILRGSLSDRNILNMKYKI